MRLCSLAFLRCGMIWWQTFLIPDSAVLTLLTAPSSTASSSNNNICTEMAIKREKPSEGGEVWNIILGSKERRLPFACPGCCLTCCNITELHRISKTEHQISLYYLIYYTTHKNTSHTLYTFVVIISKKHNQRKCVLHYKFKDDYCHTPIFLSSFLFTWWLWQYANFSYDFAHPFHTHVISINKNSITSRWK